jgi:hypothetical protein|tara:strand:- start:1409 stop:1567 length:159 start_codon:yes stop_codon:yes gene_type:complete
MEPDPDIPESEILTAKLLVDADPLQVNEAEASLICDADIETVPLPEIAEELA